MICCLASARWFSPPLACTAACWVWALVLAPVGAAQEASVADSDPDGRQIYTQQLKPLLALRCYACHGALKQEGGLRVDTVDSLVMGGDSGPALVLGRATDSLIWQRVADSDLSQRMPPEHEGEAFSSDELQRLRQWIDSGAPHPATELPEPDPRDHWSFQPLVRPPVPEVFDGDWVRNPIDAFISQRHRTLGLTPVPEAAPTMLLRRMKLDVLGLPPTPADYRELNAQASLAEQQVWLDRASERWLADPRHGQRWARHWMDIWRYSDWWGLGDEMRNSQKHIYHWRDWIVDNLNRDRSYADMVRMMLAADELAPLDLDELRATGFLARNFYLFNRHPWMDETVEHVGKSLLGLTTNCAKCHDHKYDPIDQAEYFRLRAFFEPYHVRTDMVPGVSDLNVDGIPRVFDGWLEEPTYRLIRGDEKQPDTSVVLTPDVPSFLRFSELTVSPITLPAAAWQPDRHPWVLENHRLRALETTHVAEQVLEQKRIARQAAAENLATVVTVHADRPHEPESNPGAEASLTNSEGKLVDESFATWDPERWQTHGGDWQHRAGRLIQQQTGPLHSALRWRGSLPKDFEVSLTLRIHGGDQWKSVGISFDETQADPTTEPAATDSAQNVYLSAYAAGPKVQAAWRRGSQWQYPGEAMTGRPIAVDQRYTLRLQVRDTLINAWLDEDRVLAWRTPLARRDGHLQITTFDAHASIEAITIQQLPESTILREASGYEPDSRTAAGAAWHLAKAEAEVQVAERKLALAEAQLQSVIRRGEAAQMRDHVKEAERIQAVAAAVQAERQAATWAARVAVAEAELNLVLAGDGANEAGLMAKQAAAEALTRAEADEANLQGEYTPLVGARWSATRFQFSGHDDPPVTFPPTSSGRRSALAAWITDPGNPLTARVAVNHLWNRHFGKPLVDSVFDFGRNGTAPTHPELLDWLACELVDNGWSMKHLHRLILQSATYRMATDGSETQSHANREVDPDNHAYWAWTPGRMESQVVRDALLDLAGELDVSLGGPPILAGEQAASQRRSLYFFHSNNDRNLFLTVFDEASVAECYRREQSVVPQQALALANSDLLNDAARRITLQLVQTADQAVGEQSDPLFAEHAFMVLLGRGATAEELRLTQRALSQWRQAFAAEQESDVAGRDSTALDTPAQRAREQLVWVLLNHSDFLTIH